MQTPWHTDQCVRGWGCHPACNVNQVMRDRAVLLGIIRRFVDLNMKSQAFKDACSVFDEFKKTRPHD